MSEPFLLNPLSAQNRSPAKLCRDCLTEHYGCLLDLDTLPPVGATLGKFNNLSVDRRAEWRRCLAEELLLRHACGRIVPRGWQAEFANTSPFGSDHPVALADCLKYRCACGIFPLAAGNGDLPGIGHAWVVEGLAHRDQVDGAQVVPPTFGLCVVASDNWEGCSWQLAGAMAVAVASGSRQAPTQTDLLDWVMSAQVQDDRLVKIAGLDSKGRLPLPGKRWLLPRENAVEADLKALRQRLRMVFTESSLHSAMALVSEQGTRLHQLDANQIVCDEMHALIGGAPQPVIAAFLLSTAHRLVLWHSEKTIDTAKLVASVVDVLVPNAKVALWPLPSDSVVAAEKILWSEFGKSADTRIAFNVTGGNRLMSYAVHTMAKLFDNLTLVYRDTDAPPHQFVEIVYRQDNASEGALDCRPRRCADLEWKVLYENSKERPDAAAILTRMGVVGTPREMVETGYPLSSRN